MIQSRLMPRAEKASERWTIEKWFKLKKASNVGA